MTKNKWNLFVNNKRLTKTINKTCMTSNDDDRYIASSSSAHTQCTWTTRHVTARHVTTPPGTTTLDPQTWRVCNLDGRTSCQTVNSSVEQVVVSVFRTRCGWSIQTAIYHPQRSLVVHTSVIALCLSRGTPLVQYTAHCTRQPHTQTNTHTHHPPRQTDMLTDTRATSAAEPFHDNISYLFCYNNRALDAELHHGIRIQQQQSNVWLSLPLRGQDSVNWRGWLVGIDRTVTDDLMTWWRVIVTTRSMTSDVERSARPLQVESQSLSVWNVVDK